MVQNNDDKKTRFEKIQEALSIRRSTAWRHGISVEQLRKIADGTAPAITTTQANKNILQQRSKREIPPRDFRPLRNPLGHQLEITYQVKLWLESEDNDYYLGFGGMGDALLVLTACWNNPRAKAVFFANNSSIKFIEQFFLLFEIPCLLFSNIMGQPWANNIHKLMQTHPNFKTSGHLADNLDYGDWKNEHKYIPRIITNADWKGHFGIRPNPCPTKKVLVICPSGSHRDTGRQRFLTQGEYNVLVKKYIELNYTVYTLGSDNDLRVYGSFPHPHAIWATSDKIREHKKPDKASDLKTMLQIIHSADEVLSMDTWLKTYSLIVDIPTTVILTRWGGRYRKIGEDTTDWIFMNDKIWPKIKFAKTEELLASV